jgi:hypothetical protein
MPLSPTTPKPESPLPPEKTIAAWRILLRGAGAFFVLYVICVWAAKGYNRGWTQDQIPVKHIDQVTEIEYIKYEKRFVPGLDVLAAGVTTGLVLFSVTFLGRRCPPDRA